MFSLASSRRRLPAALRLLLVAAATTWAVAAPAQPSAQVPGYYRQAIGDLRVTALFDGVVPLPRAQLTGIAPAQVDALLADRHVPEGEKGLQTAVNAYLVERGGLRVLVDAGTAQCFGEGLGQVLANLRASGFRPEDVDAVLMTHAHPDHLCGVLDAQGAVAYPKATLWLAREEAAHWEDRASEAATPESLRFLFGMARRAIAPYAAAGRLRRFGPGEALPAGFTALASHGHTPGHTSFLADGGKDGAQKLLVWGDVLHYHAVQFARPDASFEADTDRPQAIASRRGLLERATREGWCVAGAHLPFPGLGHVRREGPAFAWVPAEFSPLPAGR